MREPRARTASPDLNQQAITGVGPPSGRRDEGVAAPCLSSTSKQKLPAEGLEPTRSCDHWILSPARLPIPPRRLLKWNGTIRPLRRSSTARRRADRSEVPIISRKRVGVCGWVPAIDSEARTTWIADARIAATGRFHHSQQRARTPFLVSPAAHTTRRLASSH